MITFSFFVLGLIVGSFLNVVIVRLKNGKPITKSRSECLNCHHLLSALDLVPVLSFMYLGGRCRFCRKKISWQYPIVELATAVSFALIAQNHEFGIMNYELWLELVFACFFIVIGVFDFKHYLILDKLVFPSFGLALVLDFFSHRFLDGLLGAGLISGFFAAQYFISRGRWIGFGDVKFGLLLGAVFGVKLGLLMLFLGYVIGALVGIGLIVLGKKNLSSKLPFGTFLSLSAIINMLIGERILSWYLRLIGL